MLNENGYEIPDDTPVSVPARLRLPQSRASQIQAFIRQELSRSAEASGVESFDEANDLDVAEFADFGITDYERSAEFGFEDISLLTPGGPAEPGGAAPGGEPKAKEGAQPPADSGLAK